MLLGKSVPKKRRAMSKETKQKISAGRKRWYLRASEEDLERANRKRREWWNLLSEDERQRRTKRARAGIERWRREQEKLRQSKEPLRLRTSEAKPPRDPVLLDDLLKEESTS